MLFSFTSSSPYAQVLDISALRPLFLSPLIGSADPPQALGLGQPPKGATSMKKNKNKNKNKN